MNTSFPRINDEVKKIIEKNRLQNAFETIAQQSEEAFEGTVLEGKSRKYTILSHKDLNKYIDPFTQNEMWIILDRILGNIENGREKDGKKPFNSYITINTDEPYINEVIDVMKRNGDWESDYKTKHDAYHLTFKNHEVFEGQMVIVDESNTPYLWIDKETNKVSFSGKYFHLYKVQRLVEAMKRLAYAAFEFVERNDEIIDDKEEFEHFVERFKRTLDYVTEVEKGFKD